MTLRTLNYGNYGIFLIMGNAGFCPSTILQNPDGYAKVEERLRSLVLPIHALVLKLTLFRIEPSFSASHSLPLSELQGFGIQGPHLQPQLHFNYSETSCVTQALNLEPKIVTRQTSRVCVAFGRESYSRSPSPLMPPLLTKISCLELYG